jgi:transcriptional regulator with XRE-family HTH domain
MSPEQCRAARAWLGWSMDALAERAHVSNSTVRDFEARRRRPIANNLAAIRGALEAAGIEFLSSDGVAEGIVFNGSALAGDEAPSERGRRFGDRRT